MEVFKSFFSHIVLQSLVLSKIIVLIGLDLFFVGWMFWTLIWSSFISNCLFDGTQNSRFFCFQPLKKILWRFDLASLREPCFSTWSSSSTGFRRWKTELSAWDMLFLRFPKTSLFHCFRFCLRNLSFWAKWTRGFQQCQLTKSLQQHWEKLGEKLTKKESTFLQTWKGSFWGEEEADALAK